MLFYTVKGNPFLPNFHFFHQAMRDVTFPTTAAEIIRIAGSNPVQMDWEVSFPMEMVVGALPFTEFDSAAQFYNCVLAQLYRV